MIELFPNLSESFKERARFIIDLALQRETLPEAIEIIKDFSALCTQEEEKDFLQFYLNIKKEALTNENNND